MADAEADDVADEEDVGDAVDELVARDIRDVIVGRTTPAHLMFTLEL